MIALALFVIAGILYVLATYWRERTVPDEGSARPDRVTTLLMLEATCGTIAAVALPIVHMVVYVS